MSGHELLQRWLQDGGDEPLPPALQEHVHVCLQCRRELDEVRQQRQHLSPQGAVLSSDTANAIRFQLKAAARTAEPDARGRRQRRIAVAAAAVLILAGMSWVLTRPTTNATVAPAENAVVEHISALPAEVVALRDGQAEFEVQHLDEGESFRVMAGDGWVEVRGTRFDVHVDNAELQSVDVSEGSVLVSLGGRAELLQAGDRWTRPQPVVADRSVPQPAPTAPAQVAQPPAQITQVADAVAPPQPLDVDRPEVRQRSRPPKATGTSIFDRQFREGFEAARDGDAATAIARLRPLAREPQLGDRRSDALFWLAQAHLQQNERAIAKAYLEELVSNFPSSWNAERARNQLHALK